MPKSLSLPSKQCRPKLLFSKYIIYAIHRSRFFSFYLKAIFCTIDISELNDTFQCLWNLRLVHLIFWRKFMSWGLLPAGPGRRDNPISQRHRDRGFGFGLWKSWLCLLWGGHRLLPKQYQVWRQKLSKEPLWLPAVLRCPPPVPVLDLDETRPGRPQRGVFP